MTSAHGLIDQREMRGPKIRSRYRAACSAIALMSSVLVWTPAASSEIRQTAVASQNIASEYDFVDCKLPGRVIRNGRFNTRVQRGKLIRATARTCEIRGGQYVLEDRGSFEGSLDVWLAEASTGDAKAQTYVGELYERGPSGRPDLEMARIWYKRAAEQGYAPAQFKLARFLDDGLGGPRDPERAAELYYAAMNVGDSLKRVLNLVDAEEVERLNQTIGDRDATIAQQQQRIDQLTEQMSALDHERRATLRRVNALEGDLAGTRQKLASTLSAQAQQTSTLQAQLNDLEAERSSLDQKARQLASLEAELADRQDRLTQAVAAESALRQSANMQQLSDDLERANNRIALLTAERDRAQTAEAAAIAAARTASTDVQQQFEALAQRERDLARKEAALAQTTDASSALSQEKAELEQLRADLSRERATLDRSSEQLLLKLNELEDLRTDLQQAQIQLSEEREQLRRKAAQVESTVAVSQSFVSEREALEAQFLAVKAESDRLAASRSDYETRLSALMVREAQLQSAEAEFSAQSSTISAKESEIDRLNSELEEASARADRAEDDLASAKAALDQIFNVSPRGTSVAANPEKPKTDEILSRVEFGNYHAILIGNENYDHPDWPDLVTPHEDVDRLSELLEDRYGFNTLVLKDATEDQMQRAIDEKASKMRPNDNLLIYFAGHGQYFQDARRGFWEPVDSIPNKSFNSIESEWVTQVMVQTNAQKVLIIADSCYSGILTRGPRSVLQSDVEPELLEEYLQTQAKSRSRTVLASGGLQPVADDGGGKHSLFANALIRTLEENREVVFASELAHEVKQQVVANAMAFRHEQRPEYKEVTSASHAGGDFIFVPKTQRRSTG